MAKDKKPPESDGLLKEDTDPEKVAAEHFKAAEDNHDTGKSLLSDDYQPAQDLSIATVFKAAWELFSANAFVLIGLSLLTGILVYIIVTIGLIIIKNIDLNTLILYTNNGNSGESLRPLLLLASLLMIFFIILLQVFSMKSLLIYGKNKFSINDAFRLGFKYFSRFFLVSATAFLVIMLGYTLIIPGIVFTIWFSFSPIAAIDQDLNVRESFKASKRMVNGNIGSLFVLSITFILLNVVLTSINLGIITIIISLVLSAYGTALFVEVYNRIKQS